MGEDKTEREASPSLPPAPGAAHPGPRAKPQRHLPQRYPLPSSPYAGLAAGFEPGTPGEEEAASRVSPDHIPAPPAAARRREWGDTAPLGAPPRPEHPTPGESQRFRAHGVPAQAWGQGRSVPAQHSSAVIGHAEDGVHLTTGGQTHERSSGMGTHTSCTG